MSHPSVVLLVIVVTLLPGCSESNAPTNGTVPAPANTGPVRHKIGTPQGHHIELPAPVVRWCEQVIKEAETETMSSAKPWPGGPVPYLFLTLPSGTYYMWAPGNKLSRKEPPAIVTSERFARLNELASELDRAKGDIESAGVKKLLGEMRATE